MRVRSLMGVGEDDEDGEDGDEPVEVWRDVLWVATDSDPEGSSRNLQDSDYCG